MPEQSPMIFKEIQKYSTTKKSKIHKVWHLFENYQAHKEAENYVPSIKRKRKRGEESIEIDFERTETIG